ncbi:MAG: dTMP kinase, partial [Candidatus Omnitrophica bacterium]|nr:dTMP kinase [Candidatus Omnitrophota bacterium]
KSTHSKLLYNYLKRHSYDCVYTREPGGTKVGEHIRRLLLHSNALDVSDLTEVFLFEAARARLVDEIISPCLKKGRIVVCDRFSDATVCYQGYGGKVPLKIIMALNNIATRGVKPNLTILLDVDVIRGLKMAKKKGADRIELKGRAYHKRVKAGYLELARKEPNRIKVVKVKKDIYDTQREIRRIVLDVLSRYKGS